MMIDRKYFLFPSKSSALLVTVTFTLPPENRFRTSDLEGALFSLRMWAQGHTIALDDFPDPDSAMPSRSRPAPVAATACTWKGLKLLHPTASAAASNAVVGSCVQISIGDGILSPVTCSFDLKGKSGFFACFSYLLLALQTVCSL